MSAKNGTPSSTRWIVRGALAAVYLAIMILMLVTGRSHTILIDNKGAADDSYLAVDGMEVQIDRQEALEYYPGDRDKAVVKGQRHTIKVEVFADGTVVEKQIRLPFGQDMVLLSVPKMLSGIEPWLEPFTPLQAQAQAQEDQAAEDKAAEGEPGMEGSIEFESAPVQ
jgi:hypothetical protein